MVWNYNRTQTKRFAKMKSWGFPNDRMRFTQTRPLGILHVRMLLAIAIAILLLLLGTCLVRVQLEDWRAPVRAQWENISVGDSKVSVLQQLGEPDLRYDFQTAPELYYVSGYAYKVRAITGQVFIYKRTDLVMYVWFDQRRIVEDTFIGGS